MSTRLALSLIALLGGGLWLWSAQAQSEPAKPAVEGKKEAVAPAAVNGSPSDVAKALFKAIHDEDAAAMKKLLLPYSGASVQATGWLEEREQNLLKMAKNGFVQAVLEEKVLGDCAALVINEVEKGGKPAFDIDPAFLLRHNGQWYVFHKITKWDLDKYIPLEEQPASMKLTGEQRKNFTELSTWFAERSSVLRAEHAAKLKAAPKP